MTEVTGSPPFSNDRARAGIQRGGRRQGETGWILCLQPSLVKSTTKTLTQGQSASEAAVSKVAPVVKRGDVLGIESSMTKAENKTS